MGPSCRRCGLGAWLAVASVAAPAGAVDYSAKGALPTTSTQLPQSDTVAYPTTSGTYPWVVVAHDQLARASDLVALGQHLASHGVVAVVAELCPSPGSGCAPSASTLASKVAVAKSVLSSAFLPVKVDTEKLGLVGHGTGAYVIADADVAGVVTRVLLDPRHALATPIGPATVMAKQQAPVLSLFAPPNDCNALGVWEPAGVQTGASVSALAATVVKASHCDAAPEWSDCPAKCGQTPLVARAAKFRGAMTAWLLGRLKGDAAATCAVSPAALEGDLELTNVRANFPAPSCGGGGSGGSSGAAGKAGAAGKSGAGGAAGKAGASGKGGSGGAGQAGSGGAAAKSGSGSPPGAAGAPPGAGGAAGGNPDDGRNQYFELEQLKHEGLGDAEAAPACSVRGTDARAFGWLAPLGLALAWRRRARGRA
ncbi:MAG: hypothetical protein IT374_22535 [Polyangiaceae bacterium]|nr:hypothetical protein [Polyangiaceae bacterium]